MPPVQYGSMGSDKPAGSLQSSEPKQPKQPSKPSPKEGNKRKRYREDLEDDQEEERLTRLLFGKGDNSSEAVEESEAAQSAARSVPTNGTRELFILDRDGDIDDEDAVSTKPRNSGVELDSSEEAETKSVAWKDEDDMGVSVNAMDTSRLRKLRTHREEDVTSLPGSELEKRLRKRFENTTMASARTDWASVGAKHDSEDEGESDELVVSSSEQWLRKGHDRLPHQLLQIVRCKDANQKDPNDAVVRAVNFHSGSDPNRPLMLTAGMDKTLRFFHVGEEESDKIHGIHFPKLPIYSASFLGDSGNVVVSGRRSFFYIYDAAAGKVRQGLASDVALTSANFECSWPARLGAKNYRERGEKSREIR